MAGQGCSPKKCAECQALPHIQRRGVIGASNNERGGEKKGKIRRKVWLWKQCDCKMEENGDEVGALERSRRTEEVGAR